MKVNANFKAALENVHNICGHFCLLLRFFLTIPFPGQGSRAQVVREAVWDMCPGPEALLATLSLPRRICGT